MLLLNRCIFSTTYTTTSKRGLAVSEKEYQEMTKEEMQRLIDEEMRDGKSWHEALEKLALIIGIKPVSINKD